MDIIKFSNLSIKVIGPKIGRGSTSMRDGDGDGRCQEENGKWVPCPPGVSDGSIINAVGEAIGSIGEPIGKRPQKLETKIQERRRKAAEKAARITQRASTALRQEREQLRLAEDLDVQSLFQQYLEIKDKYPRPNRRDFDNPDDFYDALDEWRQEAEEALRKATEEITEKFKKEYAGDLTDIFSHDEIITTDGQLYRVGASVTPYADGFRLSLQIFNENDDMIGTANRRFSADGTVTHDDFQLDEEVQGVGLGSQINARNEILYKALGYKAIETHGMSDEAAGMVGATHWPRQGFDWYNDDVKRNFLAVIDRAVNSSEWNTYFSSEQERDEVKELLRIARQESFDDPDRLTAADLLNWEGAKEWFAETGASFHYYRNLSSEPRPKPVSTDDFEF